MPETHSKPSALKKLGTRLKTFDVKLYQLYTGLGISKRLLLLLAAINACILIALLLYELLWPISPERQELVRMLGLGVIAVHIGVFSVRLLEARVKRFEFVSRRRFVIEGVMLLLLFSTVIYEHGAGVFDLTALEVLRKILIFNIVLAQLSSVLSAARLDAKPFQKRAESGLSPGMLFLLTMLSVIFVGSLALMTPNASYAGLSYIDALFVSTSAVCITGLCPLDFPATFTFTGQAIVLLLIQIGALGVMSFAYFITIMLGEGFSLRDRVILADLLSQEKFSQSTYYLRNIVLVTLSIEAIGAVGIYLSMMQNPPPGINLWWCSIFHAVSAFCNAGFSLFSGNLTDRSTIDNYAMQSVVMVLIIAGGLGFAVYQAVIRYFQRLRVKTNKRPYRWSTYVWMVTRSTLFLVLAGGAFLGLIRMWHYRVAGSSDLRALWDGLFNSVSARTAGFNTVDLTLYSSPYILFVCALMFIGGSPGGTAGGVRTTTVTIAMGELWRILRGRSDVEFHNRYINRGTVEKAMATIFLSGAFIGFMTMLMCWVESGVEPVRLFFETVSAFGTVGLSLNLTPELSSTAKSLLIITMIVGRVGILAFAFAFFGYPKPKYFEYPNTSVPLN